mgnify:CR=1 FL=1
MTNDDDNDDDNGGGAGGEAAAVVAKKPRTEEEKKEQRLKNAQFNSLFNYGATRSMNETLQISAKTKGLESFAKSPGTFKTALGGGFRYSMQGGNFSMEFDKEAREKLFEFAKRGRDENAVAFTKLTTQVITCAFKQITKENKAKAKTNGGKTSKNDAVDLVRRLGSTVMIQKELDEQLAVVDADETSSTQDLMAKMQNKEIGPADVGNQLKDIQDEAAKARARINTLYTQAIALVSKPGSGKPNLWNLFQQSTKDKNYTTAESLAAFFKFKEKYGADKEKTKIAKAKATLADSVGVDGALDQVDGVGKAADVDDGDNDDDVAVIGDEDPDLADL